MKLFRMVLRFSCENGVVFALACCKAFCLSLSALFPLTFYCSYSRLGCRGWNLDTVRNTDGHYELFGFSVRVDLVKHTPY